MSYRAKLLQPVLAALLVAGTSAQVQAAEFLEGGGWFTRAGQKTFVAMNTECEAGQYKGYFEFQDKALNLSIRNALITSITSGGGDIRVIEGNANILGAVVGDITAGTFRITVADSTNTVTIQLSTSFGVSSTLQSGDISIRSYPSSACGTTGGDTAVPTVTMFSPVDATTISGTATLAATTSDNVGVSGVQFYVNNSAVGPEDTVAPYSITGNSAALANGTYLVRARARDAAGNTASSSFLSTTVDNDVGTTIDTTPPTGVITYPLTGDIVSGIVTLSVAAADNVAVAGVQFFVDGNAVGAEDVLFPFQITGNSSQVTNGSHTAMARIRDTSGNMTNSAIVTATVSNAGQVVRVEQTDASITYTNPAAWLTASDQSVSGGTVVESNTAGSAATLSFNGTGVSWVGFKCSCSAGIANLYLDGNLVGTVDAYSAGWEPQAKVYSVSGLVRGDHTFKIEVTGTYNPAGDTAYIVLDAFDVIK